MTAPSLEQAIVKARAHYDDLAKVSEGWRGACEACRSRGEVRYAPDGKGPYLARIRLCAHPLIALPTNFKASTGETVREEVFATVARSADGVCGPTGRLWESRWRWKRDLVWLKEQWRRLYGEA